MKKSLRKQCYITIENNKIIGSQLFNIAYLINILKTKNNKKIPVLVHSHNQSELLNANKFGIKKPIYIDHLICF